MLGDPDFASFLDLVWKPYPKRLRQGSDAPMGKGNQPEAWRRAKALLEREGRDWSWLGECVAAYHNHPNVKAGYVQAVEVYLGENGHWAECAVKVEGARRVQGDGQLRPSLDGQGHRGLPTLHPGDGDAGGDSGEVLEASCTPWSASDGPGVSVSDMRGEVRELPPTY